MTTTSLFRRLVDAFERTGIRYMLTGSFASSYHGSPRATQDIDFVVSASAEQLRSLVASLPQAEYYVSESAAMEAHRTQGQFNIIDMDTGWKVDLILRKSRPFSHEEFERRSVVDFQGTQLPIATAEDVVIAKLEWAKLGSSQRQIEDAAGILKVRWNQIDREYLNRWVRQLDLQEQWNAACRAAGLPER